MVIYFGRFLEKETTKTRENENDPQDSTSNKVYLWRSANV